MELAIALSLAEYDSKKGKDVVGIITFLNNSNFMLLADIGMVIREIREN